MASRGSWQDLPRTLLEQHNVGLAWALVTKLARGMVRSGPERYRL